MVFDVERIDRTLRDLEKAIYPDREKITKYKILDENLQGGEDTALEDSAWEEYVTGELWGGYDKHRWFRTEVTVPERFKEKNLVFRISTGHEGEWDALNPQFLIYINGELIQGADVNHREVLITECAESGRKYSIALLAYSGLHDRKTLINTELCVLDKLIEDIYYNIKVPLSVAKLLEDKDDNRINIINILRQVVDMIDYRRVYSNSFYDSINEANQLLKKEFYSEINYKAPLVTAIGHTHIDIAWLWTISQTKEKTVRSFSTVLNLMKQYPEYKFMSSQPQLYEYVKDNLPEMYEEIKERMKEGRWEADGAMWLEADCNIPSGESFIRQIIFGEEFFNNEFGVKSKSLWLPDVFGYSATLPQILKKCGINYFMTTKIDWNQFNRVPNDTFMWQGIDGSEILTHFVTTSDYRKSDGENITFTDKNSKTTYTGIINANQVMGTWKRYQNKDLSNETLMLFGYGDGGGGPTKEMLENARRLKYGIPGCPRLEIGFEGEFFDRLNEKASNSKELQKWVGELYLEYHRGTYTSMAKNKWYNRKSEILYQDAEMLSTLGMLLGEEYQSEKLMNGWKTILLNQFHDIIPGSAIKQAYDESHQQYEEAMKLGHEVAEDALKKITGRINLEKKSVVLFNTLSYDRDDIVEVNIPKDIKIIGLEDQEGRTVDIQFVDNGSKLVFFAKNVPSKGYKVYRFTNESKASEQKNLNIKNNIENKFFKVSFDNDFNITSIYDKQSDREVLKKGTRGNVLQAFEDRPMQWENWDIDIYYKRKMWEVNDIANAEIIESGPVRYCVKLQRNFLNSKIEQYIYFYNDIPRIDFKNIVDWKEKNILLKVAFPVDINSSKATYEIQYGNIERETHNNTSWDLAKFEVCAHKWADLSEGEYGVSLMNDSKYGYDIKDGNMRLTLIKAGTYPNPEADLGIHEFTYSIYPHGQTWKEANTPRMAYNLNVPMHSVIEQPHRGELDDKMSLLRINKDNCLVEVVKKAEKNDGVIIRIYEYKNIRERVEMDFGLDVESAYECDPLENITACVELHGSTISFEIKPYEIKTFLLNFKR